MPVLREVVRDVLVRGGLDTMGDPDEFSSLLLEAMDPDTREAKVIRATCDAAFLGPIIEAAASRDPKALSDAAAHSSAYLNSEYIIDPVDAANV